MTVVFSIPGCPGEIVLETPSIGDYDAKRDGPPLMMRDIKRNIDRMAKLIEEFTEPRTCLSCGAKVLTRADGTIPEGGMPCGH